MSRPRSITQIEEAKLKLKFLKKRSYVVDISSSQFMTKINPLMWMNFFMMFAR